jgi:hypothetical protein
MITKTEKELIHGSRVQYMLDNGKTINKMEKDPLLIQTEEKTKDFGKIEI